MTRRIEFDFRKKESHDKIDFILCYSGPGASYLLDIFRDARLLKELLQQEILSVSEHTYPKFPKHSPEAEQRAERFCVLMNKRNVHEDLLDMAELFDGRYDEERDYCKSVYFPELRVYIRCDGLKPEYLLDMLARENCDRVIVFPGYWFSDTENVYYTFECAAPKDILLEILQREADEQLHEMHEAITKANEKNRDIFPKIDFTAE